MSTKHGREPLFFYALMALAMVSWGGSWVVAKWASGYPAEVTAFWRFVLNALSLLPILLLRVESLSLPRGARLWTILSAVALAVYNVLFLTAMKHGSGGYGGVLVPTLNPLFSYVIAAAFLSHRLDRRMLAALVLGLLGGVLQILGPAFSLASFARPENLILTAAAAVYALLTHASARAQRSLSVFRYSFWTSALCAAFLLPLALPSGPFDFPSLGIPFWVDAGYLALAAGTFGTTLYFSAASRIGAARASNFAFLVPVSALVLAFLFLGERPAWTSVVGGAVSVAAVLAAHRSGGRGQSDSRS